MSVQVPAPVSVTVAVELARYVRVRLYTDGQGEPYLGYQRMQRDVNRFIAQQVDLVHHHRHRHIGGQRRALGSQAA
mgnify:CR=1 FL=1